MLCDVSERCLRCAPLDFNVNATELSPTRRVSWRSSKDGEASRRWMCLSSTLPGSEQGIALTRCTFERWDGATLAAVVHAAVVVWHTAADARLAIRSRASDCHLTDTYDLYTYRDHSLPTTHPYPQSSIAISHFLSTQPVTNSLVPDAHEQHNYGSRPFSCSSCQRNASRPAKQRGAKTRSVPRQGARNVKK